MEMPYIRIELESVRNSVAAMFCTHNEEFQQLIESTLEDTLTQEWVANRIKEAVRTTIDEMIIDASNDVQLKREIRTVVMAHILEAFQKVDRE